MTFSDTYLAYMGLAPRRIPHIEHWSNPDAETYLTGIDYYEHPRLCRLKLQELYPELGLAPPETDEPKPRPRLELTAEEAGGHRVRWGDTVQLSWDFGTAFHTPEDVFAFSPLEHSGSRELLGGDYSSEEVLYQRLRAGLPADRDTAPEGDTLMTGFYQTMFMWPLLVFGWELFLETCLDPRFERIMDEFAEINRRVYRALARQPVNFIWSHDDIMNNRGPICSPAWMRKYIFPRYEEFWAIVKASGKRVMFVADGRMDAYADDVLACGADGITTEPVTDFKALARKHPHSALAGEGDNRILTRNDPAEIEAMVRSMVKTAQTCAGYIMCIGNHIPWNVTPEGIKRYLDLSRELAVR